MADKAVRPSRAQADSLLAGRRRPRERRAPACAGRRPSQREPTYANGAAGEGLRRDVPRSSRWSRLRNVATHCACRPSGIALEAGYAMSVVSARRDPAPATRIDHASIVRLRSEPLPIGTKGLPLGNGEPWTVDSIADAGWNILAEDRPFSDPHPEPVSPRPQHRHDGGLLQGARGGSRTARQDHDGAADLRTPDRDRVLGCDRRDTDPSIALPRLRHRTNPVCERARRAARPSLARR